MCRFDGIGGEALRKYLEGMTPELKESPRKNLGKLCLVCHTTISESHTHLELYGYPEGSDEGSEPELLTTYCLHYDCSLFLALGLIDPIDAAREFEAHFQRVEHHGH